MAFSPISRVYLLDTPLDNTYKNQLFFYTENAQKEYFSKTSVIKHIFDDLTYIRKDAPIRVKAYIDDLLDSNYIKYQNPNFGNKWFYVFITKFEYINPEVTDIYIETDVYQTWLFNVDLMKSFVVREHVRDDILFNNLLDEGLDYGEYIYKEYAKSGLFTDMSFVIALSDLSPVLPENLTANPRLYDGMLSGLVYWAFDESNITGLIDFIRQYYSGENATAIEYIFTIPTAFLPDGEDGQILSGEAGQTLDWNYQSSFNSIDGYIPKNKKLFNYPYNVLSISNNMGNTSLYHFEDFLHPDDIHFNLQSNIAPSPTVMCIPRNFKKHYDFNSSVPEYGIALTGFPLCSWTSDTYRAWLAQNSASVLLGTVGGVGAMIGGFATGNLIALGGGIASISSQMAQVYKASIQPDQAKGNVQNGSFNIAHNTQDFFLQHLTIRREYAERIDNFFTMFGYKVNKLKVPNVSDRPYWNYVQTIDVNITGSIPDNDMQRLKKMYNDGVTLWKSASYFLDYSRDNNLYGVG